MSNRDPNTCTGCLSRRGLLKGGATGAALAVLPLGCMGQGSPPSGPISAGNVSEIAVGALKIFDGDAVLGRDANGLYAMSNVCTHAGCLMDVATSSGQTILSCGCHGSVFSATGAVTRGPAQSPLTHYRVDVAADGAITIQGADVVSSAARTAVA